MNLISSLADPGALGVRVVPKHPRLSWEVSGVIISYIMSSGRVERYKKTKDLIDKARNDAAEDNTEAAIAGLAEVDHEGLSQVSNELEDESAEAKEAHLKLKEKVQTVFDVMRFLRVDFEDFLEEVGVNGDTRRRRQLGQTVYSFDYMMQFRRQKRTSDIWDQVTTSSKKISAYIVGEEVSSLAENSSSFCSKEQLDKRGEELQPLDIGNSEDEEEPIQENQQQQFNPVQIDQHHTDLMEVATDPMFTVEEAATGEAGTSNSGGVDLEDNEHDKKRRREMDGVEYSKKRVKLFSNPEPFNDILKYAPHLSYVLRAAMYTDETVRSYCDEHNLYQGEKLNFEKRMNVIESNMRLGREARYLKLITIFMILCSARHLQSGIRQVQLGKIFQEAGTRRELINLLSKMGVIKSYQTIQNALNLRMKWKPPAKKMG
ncbi:hypothetical protein TRICI_003462 [Trichomonascus ciferrii]|uniref:Uncharacterized protein n=1 Tax=Trichomonascus ciferrii TaxID=44093 RepID=A0A642V526_9ASCO|nr:hypothetical protein TRICI_003462 [Trichomonascus ciferrii]